MKSQRQHIQDVREELHAEYPKTRQGITTPFKSDLQTIYVNGPRKIAREEDHDRVTRWALDIVKQAPNGEQNIYTTHFENKEQAKAFIIAPILSQMCRTCRKFELEEMGLR